MLDVASMATPACPSHSISSSSPSSPVLFATDIPNNVVELKNVILNEFHVLRKFLLISMCERALRVTLDSDLSSQIGFQLNNENIDNADENTSTEPNVATFLADDFSELYNTVNLVNEVILQARQIQQVILTFRASGSSKAASNRASEFGEHGNVQRSSDQKIYENGSVEPSAKDVSSAATQFKVNGRLFLSATVLPDEAQALLGPIDETSMDHCQDIVIHFYSTVCRCILRADVQDIVFDDCVPGGVFVKDFSIWNLSEIPCAFQIYVKTGRAEQPALDLTDYETELPITSGEIKSCAHRRIRVMYKPRDVGDFAYSIHLENSFDVQNSTCIPVHCIVNAEYRKEGLLVTGVGEDGLLDFGDCYANNGTCQVMNLRNITQEALVVSLGTDHSPGDQVNFYLQAETDISSGSTTELARFIKAEENVNSTGDVESSSTGLSQKLGNTLGASINLDKKSRVEVLSLERGEEKNLLVWFYPAVALDEAKAARLQRRTFRISLKCAEKKGRSKLRFSNIIQCKARISTSIVKLSTPELNFGDCNIGSTKSATFEIINLSDLPALVTSCVTSTILSFRNKAERVLIPPRQSYSLDIDLVPLKINPKYRKQITIDNFYNKDNQQVLEVRGKIMDRHHVLLHSLYYKLRTPSTNNFLNFDCVIINNPSVRTLAIENITDKCLTLGFKTSMPGELGIYQLRDDSQSDIGDDTDSLFSEGSEEDGHESRRRAYAASVNKEKLLETLEESQPRLSKAIVDSAPFPVQEGPKMSIPPRPPFTIAEKKARMRMSLDLATSSFISNGGDKTAVLSSSLPSSSTGDGEAKKELLSDVKPFGSTTDEAAPRPLKRVQSSAMLSAIEEGPNVVSEGSQEEVSPEGIEGVLKRLGNLVISQCAFPDEEAEKQYVDNHIKDRELLMHVLDDLARTLTPVRKLELLPGETKTLYVLLTVDGETRPSLQGRLQKLTAKVNIQLLDYEREQQQLLDGGALEQPVEDDLLTRELPVHFKACRALLSLAQKNISFGKLLTNEHRAKTLVLTNISDVPLLYKLKKTGSIASGDLHIINGRTGILRPHSDREVNFVFQPSLGGSFHETLVVGNVYDSSNDQVVTLKATISRADTFWLNTSSIDFGTVTLGEWSKPQGIVIVNNSKQSRTYVLKAADYVFDDRATKSTYDTNLPTLRFMLEEKRKRSPSSAIAPEEEAIEALERKGIALERKGKADKAAKIGKQVTELRARLASASPKKSDSPPTEGSKSDENYETSPTDNHSDHATGESDTSASGRTVLVPKGSDGYISLTLKGGDSKAVMVSIFVSPLTSAYCQRIVGTIVAFERKNRDVVKKVYYEGTTYPRALFEDSPEGVAAETFNLKLRTKSPESPFHPLITQSPSLSPESSAPTSPYGSTPQSAAIQNPFSNSSPELLSNLPPFDSATLIGSEVSGASAHKLGTDFSQELESDRWGSQRHIFEWGKEGEDIASDDVDGVVDDESSRSESGSGLSGFDPLFKVDLLHQSPNQAVSVVEQRDGDDDAGMDLSSAAALARSLVSQKIQEPGKPLFAGELILDDSPDQDRREASFLLKSESLQDIWIQFHLAWEGKPDTIELWTLGEAGARHPEGKSVIDSSARRRSRQLRWEQPDRSEYSTPNTTTYVSSLFLKGSSVSMVTLIRPDLLAAPTLNGDAQVSSSLEGKTQATGVLTMQARPDDGLSRQLLVRLKQLDRCIKVSPSVIVFPESELTTVLRQDFVIKNRTGSLLTFTINVTEAGLASLAVSPRRDKDNYSGLVSPSSEVLDTASDSVVNVYPASGHVEGHASKHVKVTCRPVKPGKKFYTVHLRTSSCFRDTEVGITMLAARQHCIHLPDLPDGITLDMGFCFINAPSGEKVVPLKLQNLAEKSLLLTFRSNLAKQVYISTASSGLKRTDDLQLSAGAHSTVFMCLRPGGDAAAFEGGQCREIIGGLRITAHAIATESANEPVEVSSPNGQKVVDEIMVKFRAIVGRSLMQVSASMMDLGRVKEVGGFVIGYFLVSNPSTQMPLHFSLSSKLAQLTVQEGHLVGRDASRLNGGTAQSDMTVTFCLPVSGYGLIEDKIIVQNLSCFGQNAELALRLFVDAGVVEACPEPPLPHFQQKEIPLISSVPRQAFELPSFGCKLFNSRQPNLLKTHGQRLPVLSGGDIGVSFDRTIRKASSGGDFFFSNLTPQPGKADLALRQQESFGPVESQDAAPFRSNPFLNLGTVFVSPTDRQSTENGAIANDNADVPIYSISDLRTYHCSLLLTNFLQDPIELQPFSTLPMLVHPEKNVLASYSSLTIHELSSCIIDSYTMDAEMEAYCRFHGDISVCEELASRATFELVTKLVCCGRPFVIQPYCTTRLVVSYSDLNRLSSLEVARLRSGEPALVEGLLVFIRSSSSQEYSAIPPDRYYDTKDSKGLQVGRQAVEILNITGSICLSEGHLVKNYIELGKVGYANKWADVELEITVENTSDAVLVYKFVNVPECFKILSDELQTDRSVAEKIGSVPRRGSGNLRITLCTSKLEQLKLAGPCSWRICLLNCNNPKNLMELVVEAEMTICNLSFGGLTEGALLLPPLTLPALPSASPCSVQFVVENLSIEPLGVALQLQQAEETESLVMLEVVSQTDSTLGELTLKPGGKVELRVCARPISDTIPSHFLAQHEPSRRTSRVGSTDALSSKDVVHSVPEVVKENGSDIPTSTGVFDVEDFAQTLPDLKTGEFLRDLQRSSDASRTVCLGQLYIFSSPHLPDCIPIHGTLLQGSSFDVSPHNLHLQASTTQEGSSGVTWVERHDTAGSSQIVVVRNFREFEALQFIVLGESEEPLSMQPFSDFISVHPLKGSIPPRGSAEIVVKSLTWSREAHQGFMDDAAGANPETLTFSLFVQDAENPERNLQRILVNIRPPGRVQEPVARTPPKILSRNLSPERIVGKDASTFAQAYKRGPLVLGLRGCTPVGGSLLCYEFNLGQQNISSGGRLHWDLTLVGDQHRPIHFRLGTISEGYASWLSISSSGGVVEAGEHKTVQLSFSTKAMGVYSTYLVVENLENPADFKTVHLSLEVVAPRNARPEAPSLTYFHVEVHGGRAEGTVIDMGEVYYNFWYRNRSFVVVNEAPVAMEFLLSSSMDKNDVTELNFSLANTSLKRFSSVTLGAKSSVRIWIHFCPGPSKDKPITEETDVMSANLYINCRLVKDYRQCIPFRAKCRYPQIWISTTDIVFSTRREGQVFDASGTQEGLKGENDFESGTVNAPFIENLAVVGSTGVPAEVATYSGESNGDSHGEAIKSSLPTTRRDDVVELLPAQQVLIIKNLFAHRKLQYIVKNDSLFFVTDVPELQTIPSTSQSGGESQLLAKSNGSTRSFHKIIVRPNMESLLTHQKSILKQKYVEEHLTVYNRSNPREKYTVSLRITAGHLRNFFAAPGRKNSYPFNRLELSITGFLSAFYSLTSHILSSITPVKLQTGQLHDARLVSKEGDVRLGRVSNQEVSSKKNEVMFQSLEKWLESCVCGYSSKDYDSLFFDFHYLTDELVFYCLKERWSRGGATLELATVQLAKLLYCALYRSQFFQTCLDCCQYFSSNDVLSPSLAPEYESDGLTRLDSFSLEVPAGESRLYTTKLGSENVDKQSDIMSTPRHCLKFLEDWTGQLRHFLSYFPDSRDDLIPLRELSQKNQVSILSCREALDRKQQQFCLYR
ncbi:unnamed protein product [Calypogeia fissa]